jgi:hypothetical protein
MTQFLGKKFLSKRYRDGGIRLSPLLVIAVERVRGSEGEKSEMRADSQAGRPTARIYCPACRPWPQGTLPPSFPTSGRRRALRRDCADGSTRHSSAWEAIGISLPALVTGTLQSLQMSPSSQHADGSPHQSLNPSRVSLGVIIQTYIL